MKDEVFGIIPGYASYGVTKTGIVKSLERGIILKQYMLNGYLIVDTFRDSLTETLPVHRAVALTWVENPNPDYFTIVNHKDGYKINNFWKNLEWTDYSGNNYHAVNNGLRPDNLPCKVRDFFTGEIRDFSSMAQAAVFMGLEKDASIHCLMPVMYGKLTADRFEFRFSDDPRPWFYENRQELISPSRYMVIVKEKDGSTREIYSNAALLKEYNLYGCLGRSIPMLAMYGNEKYPDKEFIVKDSYSENRYRSRRNTKPSITVPVFAKNGSDRKEFSSLTQCANHFMVDRSTIINRLISRKDLGGWIFNTKPS